MLNARNVDGSGERKRSKSLVKIFLYAPLYLPHMPKDSIVEIPEGSGNKYRYVYEDGQTVYKGPVGSAPDLGF